ncbi:hypothetical protein J7L48_04235 [bacterium]|nr:hypothetical protein [bacterium]
MAFWETEFVGLMDFIDNLIVKYKNKDFILSVLKELKRIRNIVPLNPGIVSMCAYGIIKPAEKEEFENGEYLVITKNEEEYFGHTKSDTENIYIENFTIPRGEIANIYYIKRDTVEEFWPTLIHEVREK